MMLFQHTVDKVMSGEKTQTRRIVKSDEKTRTKWRTNYSITKNRPLKEIIQFCAPEDVGRISSRDGILVEWTPVYLIGKTYAVQPGRGQKAVGRIRLTGIRAEDVREISEADVRAEGFKDKRDFWHTWCKMNDELLPARRNFMFSDESLIRQWMSERPAERYQCWVLEFELVKDNGA